MQFGYWLSVESINATIIAKMMVKYLMSIVTTRNNNTCYHTIEKNLFKNMQGSQIRGFCKNWLSIDIFNVITQPTKEALIGEHNQKLLFVIPQKKHWLV